ncbi:hypothetical protein GCM10011369_33440 [Neiella marina]|uniref:Catalase n=1 Tax=Neiella marina TaxID=508461 RepID=A0A8J2XRD7_9GAMM|nr:putative metalloprotease CJM1_0395 family protein [Neiella marina]GGA88604.1 hypothetical protein GCM10011369_33440 [Neiella marina]
MNIVSNYAHVPLSPVNPQTQALAHDNKVREVIRQPSQMEGFPREPGIAKDQEQVRPQTKDPRQRLVASEGSIDGTDVVESETDQSIEAADDSSQQQSGDQQNPDEQQAQQRQDAREQEQQAQEQQVVDQLEARDREVIAHEQAHAAVGGQYAGSPSYDYQRGPDGQMYAVSGEVSIDISPVPGDPVATIRKMRQVRAAALAPAEPSAQDRRVAQEAAQIIIEAQAQISAGEGDESESYRAEKRSFKEGLADASQQLGQSQQETLEDDDSELDGPLNSKEAIAEMVQRNSVIAQAYRQSSESSFGLLIGSV